MTATFDQAWALVRHLERVFNARVAQRTDAPEYQLVRHVVEAATQGRVDIEELLEHYSQTIGPLVYLAPAHTKDPDLLMSVVVHEMQHVVQFDRDGLRMTWLYIAETEGRATYEAKAYSSQIEWGHARFGIVPTLAELTLPLEGAAYMLDADDIKLARGLLVQRATAASHGHYAGASALEAISWAKQHAPALLLHP